jgi:amino acid permease
MKKFIIFITFISVLTSHFSAFAEEEKKDLGQAASQSTTTATIAWTTFTISFVVVIGIIIAIAINKSNNNQIVYIHS